MHVHSRSIERRNIGFPRRAWHARASDDVCVARNARFALVPTRESIFYRFRGDTLVFHESSCGVGVVFRKNSISRCFSSVSLAVGDVYFSGILLIWFWRVYCRFGLDRFFVGDFYVWAVFLIWFCRIYCYFGSIDSLWEIFIFWQFFLFDFYGFLVISAR